MDKKCDKCKKTLSVEDRILEGLCNDCDQDPVQCYERDYCIYEEDGE